VPSPASSPRLAPSPPFRTPTSSPSLTSGKRAPFLSSSWSFWKGETLREALAKGPLPLRKALDVGLQVAEGLAAAHGKGIVHRDVKPENVFLTKDGHAKLLDFGSPA